MKKILLITNCITISTLFFLAMAGCSSGAKNKKSQEFQNQDGKNKDLKFVYFKSDNELMTFVEKNYNDKNMRLNSASVNLKDLKELSEKMIKKKIKQVEVSIIITSKGTNLAFSGDGLMCFPGVGVNTVCCPPLCRIELAMLSKKNNELKFMYFKSVKELLNAIKKYQNDKKVQLNTAFLNPKDLKEVCEKMIKNKINEVHASIVFTPGGTTISPRDGPSLLFNTPVEICYPGVNVCCPPFCRTDFNLAIPVIPQAFYEDVVNNLAGQH